MCRLNQRAYVSGENGQLQLRWSGISVKKTLGALLR